VLLLGGRLPARVDGVRPAGELAGWLEAELVWVSGLGGQGRLLQSPIEPVVVPATGAKAATSGFRRF
jgi:hypothetical protein